MFAIRVNGVNFWEETQGCGHEKSVGKATSEISTTRDGQPRAVLRHRIHWVAEPSATIANTEDAALLIEDRTLSVTLDESSGEVALRWHSAFWVGNVARDVTLTGSNYNGLGLRFLKALDPLASHLIGGTQPDLSGSKQNVSVANWGAVTFNVPGKPATLAVFGSPWNPGGEAHFFSMKSPFAYLAATQGLDQKPLRYHTGNTFTLDYLITVYPEIKSADFLAKRGERWLARVGRQTAPP